MFLLRERETKKKEWEGIKGIKYGGNKWIETKDQVVQRETLKKIMEAESQDMDELKNIYHN